MSLKLCCRVKVSVSRTPILVFAFLAEPTSHLWSFLLSPSLRRRVRYFLFAAFYLSLQVSRQFTRRANHVCNQVAMVFWLWLSNVAILGPNINVPVGSDPAGKFGPRSRLLMMYVVVAQKWRKNRSIYKTCGNDVVEHRSPRSKDLLEEARRELPRGERQGGDAERKRVKLTALVPVPIWVVVPCACKLCSLRVRTCETKKEKMKYEYGVVRSRVCVRITTNTSSCFYGCGYGTKWPISLHALAIPIDNYQWWGFFCMNHPTHDWPWWL